jgi:two-component system chemotaxis response regulator CheB
LAKKTPIPVIEPNDSDPVKPGAVYLAPPGYHMMVADGRIALSLEDPVLFARPSIDVLFESVADEYGPAVIAVVLTGASEDGAHGAALVAKRGGRVLVQSPETAESAVAPKAALALVPTAEALPPRALARLLRDVA